MAAGASPRTGEGAAAPPLAKAGYNPDEPRVPAGDPDGGQWTSDGGGNDTTGNRGSSNSNTTLQQQPTPAPRPASGRPHLMPAQEVLPFGVRPPLFLDEPPEVVRPLKETIPRLTGKEGAKNVPSWARGNRPYVGENGRDFAKRLMDEKYGPGNWSPKEVEYRQIQKWGDRAFRDPKSIFLPEDDRI